jgi:hypothetical protein
LSRFFTGIALFLQSFPLVTGVAFAEPFLPSSPELREENAPRLTTSRQFEAVPTISVISIGALALPNPGYQVAYMSSLEGLPAFQMSLVRTMARWGAVEFSAQVSLGFGQKTGAFPVTPDGEASRSENLTLRWIPALLSGKFSYQIKGLSSIRPSVSLGFGNLTIVQSSATPGLNRAMAIPVMVVSPQLSFLDLAASNWLGGFSFGATILKGLGGDTTVSAASLDLGITILL